MEPARLDEDQRPYAAAQPNPFLSVENGLAEDQVGVEGADMFRLEEPYLQAYAAYFGRFVDAYRELGIPISMVMPQNEFNSAQVFPSCVWTPAGLAAFLSHLGPEMARRGVDVMLRHWNAPTTGSSATSSPMHNSPAMSAASACSGKGRRR